MSNWYYLMAQLPSFSISAGTPLPITEEYFNELCSRFLDDKTMNLLKDLSLEPPLKVTSSGSKLVDLWYDWERTLRIALAQIRAAKMHKEFNINLPSTSPEILQTARTATGFDSPLEAEEYLYNARLEALQKFSTLEPFSTDALLAYALKLKIAYRIRKFSEEAGMASYRKIYDTILGETT